MIPAAAALPPTNLAGLDPAWSRLVSVRDSDGANNTWHVLDNGVRDPVGTILCVHGNPTWSYLWRGLFRAAPRGWRVVAPDHLGMGYSAPLGSPRTLSQRVHDLGDLTNALNLTGPVVTVAHDWGGPISLGWALAHKSELRSVVLTNTAIARPEGDRGSVLIRLVHAPLLRHGVCVRTPIFVRGATALSRPALPHEVRRALAAPYLHASRRQSVGDFVADIPLSPDHRSWSTLERIGAESRSLDKPTLLLWGPRDPVFGERYLTELRRRFPHAQVHRYEHASHLVAEDAPQYAETVAQWVEDLSGSQAQAVIFGAGHGPTHRPPSLGALVRAPGAGPTIATSLWSALDAREHDHSPAVVEVDGVTVSWALLARRVRELTAGLATAGVQHGDRVALLVKPSAALTAVVYAVWRAGAVIVVADKGLGLAAMRRALRSAEIDHVVAGAAGLAVAQLLHLPGSRIAAGRLGGAASRTLRVDQTLAGLSHLGRHQKMLPPEPSADQDCAVVFTSGATGPAKGVVYRHRQVLAQLELLQSTYALTPQDRMVAAFAPFALLGPALGIGSAVPAIDVTQPRTLTAPDLAEAVAAVDATVVFASPAALRTVASTSLGLSIMQHSALARVRLLMSAGAPVSASMLHSLREVLPHAQAHTPYGMTEALPLTDISLAEIAAAGEGEGVCVGRALTGVELAVSPISSTGAADGPLSTRSDLTGEICVRAPHLKDRYDALWATERASSRDSGWHRTGDVGHLDADGRLWVEGRLPHVITTAEGVVTPVGIEQRVEGLPNIDSAAAVGVGPAGTQVVVVVVVPRTAPPSRLVALGRTLLASLGQNVTLAETAVTDAVREVAGVEVAAVLVARALPLDVRHASKIDRSEVARWSARLLAGSRGERRSHRGRRR